MKELKYKLYTSNIIILTILTFLVSLFYGSTTNLPSGGKYIALGGINNATTEDVYAVYYNPAMLDFVTHHQIAAEYTGLHLGLHESINRTFLGYVFPTRDKGSIGFCWGGLLSGHYNEHTISLVYSKRQILVPYFSAGVRVKTYMISYSPEEGYYDNNGAYYNNQDSLFSNGTGKTVPTLDLGFAYKFFKNYTSGLRIEDIIPVNLSLNGTSDVTIPTKIMFGVSNINPGYGLNLDFCLKGKDFITSFGIQKKFNFPLSLFGSVKVTSRKYNTKSVTLIEPSLGMELRLDGFSISYGFNYPMTELTLLGNHTLSLLYRFGPAVRIEDVTMLQEKLVQLEKHINEQNQQLTMKDKEIEELKRKLDELLKKPAVPAVPPKEKPVPPVKPKIEPEKPKEPEVPEKVKELTLEEKYAELETKYFARKEQLSFLEKVKVLESIIKEYKGKVDISKIQKEFDTLMKEKSTMEKDAVQSKAYYDKLKSRGAGKSVLIDVLNRIITKYGPYGIDVQWAKDELEKMK